MSNKILLVEDNTAVLRTMQRIIENDGFEVVCATTLVEVQAILQQDDARRGTQPVRLPEVIETVCRRVGVEEEQLRANGRHRRVTLARGLVAWLARDLTAMSFPEIARGLGRGAHSAVHGACARVQTLLDADARVDAGASGEMQVRELVAQLRHALRDRVRLRRHGLRLPERDRVRRRLLRQRPDLRERRLRRPAGAGRLHPRR